MAVATYALTTLAKVKAALGITDSSKDTLIEAKINEVSIMIQNYCGGRNFLSQSYTEIKDGKGHNKVFLNQYPATAIASVEYRGGTPSTPVWTAYSADDYYKYLDSGYVQFSAPLPRLPQCIRVNYTAGYLIDFANELTSTHTLPFDLTGVATEIVSTAINTAPAQGIDSQSTEGQSITFGSKSSDLTAQQKRTLANYVTMRYAI